MNRSRWSYAAAYLRSLASDRLLIGLAALLAVLTASSRGMFDASWLLEQARLGVLLSLAGLMASSSALLASGYPARLVSMILRRTRPAWAMVSLLALLSGLLASVATNDASLFVSIPTAVLLARGLGGSLDPAITVAVAAAGANVGSALTPIGNPQNMIIAGDYHVGFVVFTARMAPFALGGLLLIAVVTRLITGSTPGVRATPAPSGSLRRLTAGVSGIVAVALGLESGRLLLGGAAGLLITGVIYPESILGVSVRLLAIIELFFLDFSLLSLHLAPFVADASVSPLSAYLYGLLLSQAVSNVPATVLLGGRTPYWYALALGVNAGGVLALWGSLANIIALRLSGVSAWRFQAYTLLLGVVVVVWGLILAAI